MQAHKKAPVQEFYANGFFFRQTICLLETQIESTAQFYKIKPNIKVKNSGKSTDKSDFWTVLDVSPCLMGQQAYSTYCQIVLHGCCNDFREHHVPHEVWLPNFTLKPYLAIWKGRKLFDLYLLQNVWIPDCHSWCKGTVSTAMKCS